MILWMFHGENIVLWHAVQPFFKRKVGLTVVLRWSYGGLMIQVTEKHLELSADKSTKKVCETADMLSCKNMYFSHRIERIKRMQDESRGESNQNPWNPCNPMLKNKTTENAKDTEKDYHQMNRMNQIER